VNTVHTKTIDTPELATWLSGCVALGLHFTGYTHLQPEMLGAMITAALLPVAMVSLRVMARIIGQVPDDVEE